MNARLLDAMLLVGGAAIVINGLFGHNLKNDVEMPMTDEELADRTAPTKKARVVYLVFGAGLFLYGLISILH